MPGVGSTEVLLMLSPALEAGDGFSGFCLRQKSVAAKVLSHFGFPLWHLGEVTSAQVAASEPAGHWAGLFCELLLLQGEPTATYSPPICQEIRLCEQGEKINPHFASNSAQSAW